MSVLRRALSRPLPPRVGIVAGELARFRRPRYLEIGVNVGVVFLHVRAARKVGVDPQRRISRTRWIGHPNTVLRGRFVESTSDRFFAGLARRERFDVVFVDGLHTHEQSRRDVLNALRHLSADGVVLVHDCNPPSAPAADPDPAVNDGSGWCGDVWKTIVELRATREDLRVEVLDTDFGVGVIRRGPSPGLVGVGGPVADLGYADLAARRAELLGLRDARAGTG